MFFYFAEKQILERRRKRKIKIKKLCILLFTILIVSGITFSVYASDNKNLEGFTRVLEAVEEKHIEVFDCKAFGLTYDEVRYCISFVEISNPCLYGLSSFSCTETDGIVESINLTYSYTAEEMLLQRREIDRIISDIIADTEGLTNPEKIKVVYDYFADSNIYDYSIKTDESEEYNIYTLLTEHRGRCKTFSLAFKLIMDKLDIPCKVVSNLTSVKQDLDNETYHIWNKVYVSDEWLTVDLTKRLYLANNLLCMLYGLPIN